MTKFSRPRGWLPKDGMRARCRLFRARSNYMGAYFIDCEKMTMKFGRKGARDAYYLAHCCADGEKGCVMCGKEGR